MVEAQTNRNAINSARILVVDAEASIVEFLRMGLGNEGYRVDVVTNGPAALDRLRQDTFDLVILDAMLPGLDGFEICKRIRANSAIPILILSTRDKTSDVVLGLELGADGHMTKPINFAELVARVHAILRRCGNITPHHVLYAADIVLDHDAHTVERAGQSIMLTAKEFELLEFFMSHPRRVFRREAILERVWGYDVAGDTHLVEVHIDHLRNKLNDRPPRLLQTVRGIGYVWRED